MIIEGIITGIVIFVSTGTDDLLVMTALLSGKEKKDARSIFWGTMLGTIIMFFIVMTVGTFVLKVSDQAHAYLRFAGIIPLALGLMYLGRGFTATHEELKEVATNNGLVAAMVMYLSNAIDDFIVNSSTILTYVSTEKILALGAGNLIGVMIYYQFAKRITTVSQSHQFLKTIWQLAGGGLVIIGMRAIIT